MWLNSCALEVQTKAIAFTTLLHYSPVPKRLKFRHNAINRDSRDRVRVQPPLQDGVEAVTLRGLKLSSQCPHVVQVEFFAASLECLVKVDGTQRSICYP